MSTDIQANILMLEIFEPGNGMGYGTEAMLLHSSELREVSDGELMQALQHMEQEDLITQERDAYQSTPQGQVARERVLVQQGVRAGPLAKQTDYAPADLILAIAASHKVTRHFQHELVKKESLNVYLYTFSPTLVQSTLATLIQDGHLQDDPYRRGDAITITGRGLRYYQQEARLRLNLAHNEGILDISPALNKDARFSQLGLDPGFASNLENRWREMDICAEVHAFLASIILLGSILEGVLLARLQQEIKAAMTSSRAPQERKTNTVKNITDWTLQDYICVAVDIGLIPRSVEKHVHELRDTRNLVHPYKQVTSGITADQSLYRISREVAETIIDALSTSGS